MRIVVGVDGSSESLAAVCAAQDLASALSADVQLAHSVPFTAGDPAVVPFIPEALRAANIMLDRIASEHLVQGRCPTTAVLSGDPAASLARLSEVPDVGLVIVGSRGVGAAVRVLLGSTSDALAQLSRKPVLILKSRSPMPSGWRCILVGVDGSAEAHEAVRVAAQIAKATRASLRIACVARSAEEYDRAFATAVVREAAARAGEGVEIERVVLEGRPAEALAEAGRARDVGMIAVGHRGRSAMQRVLLGSVADRLAHISTAPVLIVR
jgi:nucleotide-binding universal stress UspA family protein